MGGEVMRVMRRTVLGLLASAGVAAGGAPPPGGPRGGVLPPCVAAATPKRDHGAVVVSRANQGNGGLLYLITHSAAPHSSVRFSTPPPRARARGVFFEKGEGATARTGPRLSGIPSLDGQWLFSVYARPDKGSFVHALNLDAAVAF